MAATQGATGMLGGNPLLNLSANGQSAGLMSPNVSLANSGPFFNPAAAVAALGGSYAGVGSAGTGNVGNLEAVLGALTANQRYGMLCN